jgi:hypothetical protein
MRETTGNGECEVPDDGPTSAQFRTSSLRRRFLERAERRLLVEIQYDTWGSEILRWASVLNNGLTHEKL